MAKLVVREGASAGKQYVFPARATSVVLGRSAASDLQVLDAQSSRRHAEITIDGGRFTLRDLGSSNGTLLNGRKIEGPEEIGYGVRIQIGAWEIELVDDSAEDAGPLPEIPGHRLLEKIGSGGMGTVYKAQQLSMDRIVAVKILSRKFSRDGAFIGRFVREARAAGRLGHPNVIHVNDVGVAGDVHYFSMEYVDGTTVKQMLKEHGRLDVDQALDIILQTARALKYAHDNGIIHRDVKPDNIMINKEGAVKIADLGIAKTFDDASSDGGQKRVFGTPHYMAPEQALGKDIDARADIYSLGATFYHVLTGSTPFTGKTVVEVLKAHIEGNLPPVQEKAPEVPDAVVFIVERMMARQREKRYPSTADLIEDIGRVQHDREAEIERLPAGESSVIPSVRRLTSGRRKKEPGAEAEEEPRRPPRPAGVLVGLGVVVGLVVLFGLTVFLARRLGGEEGPEALLERARKLRREGRDDDARVELARLLDTYPESPLCVLARELLDELGEGEGPGRGEEPGPIGPEAPLLAEPEAALKRVEDLEAEGDLEGALAAIRKCMETNARDPGFMEKAKAAEKRLDEAIKEKGEQAAREALAEVEKFAEENPGDVQGLISRLRAYADTFAGTRPAAKAKRRADGLARGLAAKRAEEARRDYSRARQIASEARRRGDYDSGVGAYREFLGKHPDSRQAGEARREAGALEEHVKSAFERALAEANTSFEAGRHKLACGALERFTKTHRSQKWNSEARQKLAAMEGAIEDAFKKEHEKVKGFLIAFRYEDAGIQYRLLAARFGGTRWQRFVEGRLREIEVERELHRELIRRIDLAGAVSPKVLPFPAPKVPEKMAELRWRVLAASELGVTLGAGTGGRTLRSCRWEEFPAGHLIDLFEAFFPEPTREEHFALAYLCKERDLEARARRHLEAAAGN